MRSLERAYSLQLRSVSVDMHNVDKMLAKKKGQLSEPLHAVLLELYIMHLRSEGRSDNTQYAALYRLFKYLSWLEEKGMRMDSATALDVKAFLAGFDVVATRHRMAAMLEGFYRFLMEHFDEVREVLVSRGMEVKVDAAFFEKVYRGLKARPPRNYPLPEIPPDLTEKVKKMIDHADQPYKTIIIYETGARTIKLVAVFMSSSALHLSEYGCISFLLSRGSTITSFSGVVTSILIFIGKR